MSGQAEADSFLWIGTAEGDWQTPSNWADLTTGTTPSAIAPDAASSATIANGAVISGDGAAGGLYITGNVGTPPVTLAGSFALGLLSLSGADGAAEIAAGATAVVDSLDSSLDNLAGLTIDGTGARLDLTGSATVGANSTILVADGGQAQLATAAAATLTVADTLSALEIGTIGGIRAGTLEIDAGQTVSAAVAAPVVAVDGLLIVGTTEITSSGEIWSGRGTIGIATGTTLEINGNLASGSALSFDVGAQGVLLLPATVPAGTTITLTGASAVLGLPADAADTVVGLQLGDDLVVEAGASIAGATYVASAAGTGKLDLLDPGGAVLGTIALLGSFAGDTFLVTPLTDDGHTAQINIAGQGTGVFRQAEGTYTWVGPAGGAWDSPIDWSSGTVPTSALGSAVIDGASNVGDDALYLPVVGPGGAETVTLNGNVAFDGDYTFGGVTAGTGDLLIEGTLDATTMFTQVGGDLRITAGSTLDTPGINYGAGTYTVPATAGTVSSPNFDIVVSGSAALLQGTGYLENFAEADISQTTITARNGGIARLAGADIEWGTLDLSADAGSAITFGTAAVAQVGSVVIGTNARIAGSESVDQIFVNPRISEVLEVQMGTMKIDAAALVNQGNILLASLTVENSFIQSGDATITDVSVGGSLIVDTELSSNDINVAGDVVDNGTIETPPGNPNSAILPPLEMSIGGVLSGTGVISGGGLSISGEVTGSVALMTNWLSFASDVAATDQVTLTGTDAMLLISAGSALAMDAPISGFDATDSITIMDGSTIASALFTQTGAGGGTLALMDASGNLFGDLTLEGTYAPHQFAVASSSDTAATVTNTITLTAPCFVTGTGIATPGGAVAVERLRVGQDVLTAAGAVRRICWIGHRAVACRRHPNPELVLPVRIEAGAFAPRCPERALRLSPDHAVFVDGVLVPVKHLINGHSIVQQDVAQVTYWHVELDSHDILLAEGLAVESYFDTGNRHQFADAAVQSLHPDFSPEGWETACAPLLQSGPRLAALKQALFVRAGLADAKPEMRLRVRAGQCSLLPAEMSPTRWVFELPRRTRQLALESPAWMPTACLAGSLDRRRLGIRLSGVTADGVRLPLDSPHFAAGFHAVEKTSEGLFRWTSGMARLTLPPRTREVALHLAEEVAFWPKAA